MPKSNGHGEETKPAGQRFEHRRRSGQVIFSARVALDPQQDADIIALLGAAERGSVASLVRMALRACYQAAPGPEAARTHPRVEVREGDAGVILSGPDQEIVIASPELQRVITELAAVLARQQPKRNLENMSAALAGSRAQARAPILEAIIAHLTAQPEMPVAELAERVGISRTTMYIYLQQLEQATQTLQKSCRSMRIDFARMNSGDHLDVSLSSFLATRAATMR